MKEREPAPKSAIIYLLYNNEGKVLVERRTDKESDYFGKHIFPGGKVEGGETSSAALVREVKEETGLEVESMALIDNLTATTFSDNYYLFNVYLVHPIAGDIINLEGRNGRKWVSLEEANEILEVDLSKRILNKLKDVLGHNL